MSPPRQTFRLSIITAALALGCCMGAWAAPAAQTASTQATVDYILLPLSAPRSAAQTPHLLGLDQLLASGSARQPSSLSVVDDSEDDVQHSALIWRPQADTQVVAAQVIGLASAADVQGLGICTSQPSSPLLSAASCSALSFGGNEPIVLTLSGIGVQMSTRVTGSTDLAMSGSIIRQQPVQFSQDFLAVPIGPGSIAAPQATEALQQVSANLGANYWLSPTSSVGLSWAYREQAGNLFLNGFRERSINLGFTHDQLSGIVVGRVVTIDSPAQRLSGNTLDMGLILRLPWRAALSVGAKNVLKSGAASAPKKPPTGIAAEDDLLDRMAYIRYEQDL